MIKSISFASLMLIFFVAAGFAQTAPPDDQKTPPAKPSTYTFPEPEKRLKRYFMSMVGPASLANYAITAGIAQAQNDPEEWEKTGTGYARRFGSRFGTNVIRESTKYGLSEVLRQDPEYVKCDCKGVGKRLGYALKSGFTARTKSGKTVFSVPKVVSPFVANVAAVHLWYPDRFTTKDGLRQGARGLAFSVGFNLIREFILK